MSHPMTQALLSKIEVLLRDHDIGEYVIALKDPDSDNDTFMSKGSPVWVIGASEAIKFRAKLEMKEEFEPHTKED